MVIEELELQISNMKEEHAKEVKQLQDEAFMTEQQLVAARCEGSKNGVFKKSYEKMKEELKALRQENRQLRDCQIAMAER